jgi:hypothetical protein
LDPILEDLATLHLDILASEKGYQRPVPNLWTTWNYLRPMRKVSVFNKKAKPFVSPINPLFSKSE